VARLFEAELAAFGHDKKHPSRNAVDYFPAALADVSAPAEAPIVDVINQASIHRVGVDIQGYLNKFAQSSDDPGKESFAPDMPAEFMNTIVGHGEYTQYPAHYDREANPLLRLHDEMKMIPHYAKILDLETILALRPFHDLEKHGFYFRWFEQHFLSIDASADVISSALPQ